MNTVLCIQNYKCRDIYNRFIHNYPYALSFFLNYKNLQDRVYSPALLTEDNYLCYKNAILVPI